MPVTSTANDRTACLAVYRSLQLIWRARAAVYLQGDESAAAAAVSFRDTCREDPL